MLLGFSCFYLLIRSNNFGPSPSFRNAHLHRIKFNPFLPYTCLWQAYTILDHPSYLIWFNLSHYTHIPRVDSPLSDAHWLCTREPCSLGYSSFNIPIRAIIRICLERGVSGLYIKPVIDELYVFLTEIFNIKVGEFNVLISPHVGHFEFPMLFASNSD